MSRDCHIHPFPRLVPALTLLAQLLARGTSVTDIAPVVPLDGLGSNDTFSLYCSRYGPSAPAPARAIAAAPGTPPGVWDQQHRSVLPAASS